MIHFGEGRRPVTRGRGSTSRARRCHPVAAEVRRGRSAGGSVDARDGLILEAGRLVVLVQVGLEREGLVAAFALEVLESRMRLHVSAKVGSICKAFSAVGTPVWLVPRM